MIVKKIIAFYFENNTRQKPALGGNSTTFLISHHFQVHGENVQGVI
jgi:hypothetical protein